MRLSKILVFLLLSAAFTVSAQSWQELNLPDGGTVTTIKQIDDNTIFAGTARGLYQKNTTTGEWEVVDADIFRDNYINYMFYSETGYLYVGAGDYMYRSPDGGQTWDPIFRPEFYDFNGNLKTNYISLSSVDEDYDGVSSILYASDFETIYQSTDNGSTWDELLPDADRFACCTQDLLVDDWSGNVFLTANDSLYYYDISSTTFQSVKSDFFSLRGDLAISNDPASNDTLYIANNGTLFGYDISSDTVLVVNDQGGEVVIYDEPISGSPPARLLIGDRDEQILEYNISTGIMSTLRFVNNDIFVIALEKFGTTVWAGLNGGDALLTSTDEAANFTVDNTSLKGYYTGFGTVVPSTDEVIISQSNLQGGLYSADLGENWSLRDRIFSNDPIFYDTATQRLFHYGEYSDDLGVNSTPGTVGGDQIAQPYTIPFYGTTDTKGTIFIYPRTNSSTDPDQYTLYRSLDSGKTYQSVYTIQHNDRSYKSYHFSPNSGSIFIARPNQDEVNSSDLVIRSTDDGDNWTDVTPAGVTTWQYSQTSMAEDTSGTIYLGVLDAIYRTTDDGDSWEELTLPFCCIRDLFYIKGILFATTYDRIYTSVDQAESWNQYDPWGEPIQEYKPMFASENYLWFLTRQRLGIFDLNTLDGPAQVQENVTVKQISSNHIEVAWTGDSPGNDGIRVYLSEDGTNFTLDTDITDATVKSSGSYLINTEQLTEGQTYTVRLEAYNEVSSVFVDQTITYRVPTGPIITTSPEQFRRNDQVTITYFPENSYPIDDLVGAEKIYMYSGIVTQENLPTTWSNVQGDFADTQNGGVGLMTDNGDGSYSISINPEVYYGIDSAQNLKKLAFVFRDSTGTKVGKTDGLDDVFLDVSSFEVTYRLDGNISAEGDQQGINDAVFVGGDEIYDNDRFENPGAALTMDGEDDYLEIPHQPAEGQPWSISMWIRPEREFFNIMNMSSNGKSWFLMNNTAFFVGYGTSSNEYFGWGKTPTELGKWEHITITYDGDSTLSFYSNGVYNGQSTLTGLEFNIPIQIGTPGPFGDPHWGSVDDVVIDPYVIPQDTVWSYYQNFNPPGNFKAFPAGDSSVSYSYNEIPYSADYTITRTDGINTVVYNRTGSGTFTDDTVRNGVSYEFTIQSVDQFGYTSQLSDPIAVQTFNGLVASYEMDDGFIEIDNVGGNDGQAYSLGNGEPSGLPRVENRFGDEGSALQFDGVDDSISTAHTFPENSAFSVSAWVNWNNTGNNIQEIVSWNDPTLANRMYLGVQNGIIRFGDPWGLTGVEMPVNEWTHIVGTLDTAGSTNTYTLYLNGQEVASNSVGSSVQYDNLVIGAINGFGEVWSGTIDEVKIFNKPITPTDVQNIYSFNSWPGTQLKSNDSFKSERRVSSGAQNAILMAFQGISSLNDKINGFEIDVSNSEGNDGLSFFSDYRIYVSSSPDTINSLAGNMQVNGNRLVSNNLGIQLNDTDTVYIYLVADVFPEISRLEGATFFDLLEQTITTDINSDAIYGNADIFNTIEVRGIQDDLAAYYPFGDNDAKDASGNNNDGVVEGPVKTVDIQGLPDGAYLFDGIDDKITAQTNQSLDTLGNEFTLSAWVNIDDWFTSDGDTREFAPIFTKGVTSEQFGLFIIDGSIVMPGIGGNVTPQDPIPLDQWILITMTFKDGISELYLNGEFVGTGTGVLPSLNNEELLIGQNDGGDEEFFDGSIDEVRVYSRVLPPGQINYLYTQTEKSLLAHYPMDNGAIDLIDSNNGIITGDPDFSVPDRSNESGKAVEFNGDDKIEIVDAGNYDLSQAFGLSFWVKLNENTSDNYLFEKRNDNEGWFLYIDVENKVYFQLTDQAGNLRQARSNPLDDGNWHFVTASADASGIVLTVDGVDQIVENEGTAEFENFQYLDTDESLFIASTDIGSGLKVVLDEVKLFNRVLEGTEVLDQLEEGISEFFFNSEKNVYHRLFGSRLSEVAYEIEPAGNDIIFAGAGSGAGEWETYDFSEDYPALVKLNPTTNEILFEYAYRNNLIGYFYDVKVTETGILAAGYVVTENNSSQALVVKLDPDGNEIWSDTFGGSSTDIAWGVDETNSGNTIVTGYTFSNDGDFSGQNNGAFDAMARSYDADGNVMWTNAYGGSNTDVFWDVHINRMDEIFAVGYSSSQDGDISSPKGDIDAWLVRLNGDGTIGQEASYGDTEDDRAYTVTETIDNNILIGGNTTSFGVGAQDAYLVKIDPADLSVIWSQAYGGSSYEIIRDIGELPDGYIIHGSTESTDFYNNVNNGGDDQYIIKTDLQGNLSYALSYGGADTDSGHGLAITDDNKVYTIGNSFGSGGDLSYFKGGASDILITQNLSDQAQLIALEFEGLLGLFQDPTDNSIFVELASEVLPSEVATSMEFSQNARTTVGGTQIPNGNAGFIYENFEGIRLLDYVSADGTLTEAVSNPSVSTANPSTVVGEYTRNGSAQFDIIRANPTRGGLFGDISKYVSGEKVLKLDVYTDAPTGTPIYLQFEEQRSVSSFPVGRHSVYEAATTTQNEWETLTFSLREELDPTLGDYQSNQLVILFDPDNLTNNTYYFDNLRSEVVQPSGTVTVDLTQSSTITVTSENGKISEDWILNITRQPLTDNDIVAFDVEGLVGDPVINTDNHTVSASVANAAELTALSPVIEVSLGATLDPESGTERNFFNSDSNPIAYTVTAESGDAQDWLVSIDQIESNEADITSFTLPEIVGDAIIDEALASVDVTVSPLADITNLTPAIGVSLGATISPASGIAQNFTDSVVYTVTAEDGTTTRDWTVKVTRQVNSEAEILDFDVEGLINSSINSNAATVTASVSTLADLTQLAPEIIVSDFASISPESGTTQDFTNPVDYTVTAEDGTTKEWTITISQQVSNKADINSFTFTDQVGEAEIGVKPDTVEAQIVFGGDLTSIAPDIGISLGAEISPASGVTRDFSTSLEYTVTAQDGFTTRVWTVIITEAPNFESDIISFSFDGIEGSAEIDPVNHTVTATASANSNYPNLTPTIEVSDGASISPPSGTQQDFSGEVIYTVTAGDGITAQEWSVTIDRSASDENEIISFTYEDKVGVIYSNEDRVEIIFPETVDLANDLISPTIEISEGASISPDPTAEGQNFSDTVEYTVTSESGIDRIWKTVAIVPGQNGTGPGFGSVSAPGSYTKGSGGTSVSVNLETTFTNVSIFKRKAGDGSFNEDPADQSGGTSATYDLIDDDFNNVGAEFFFRGSYNFAGENVSLSSDTLIISTTTETVDISNEFNYGSSVDDYQIVAFPLQNPDVNAIFESYLPYDKSQWRLLRWRTANESYEDYSEGFNSVAPGIGYFFISTNDGGELNVGGPSVEVTNGVFTINLQNGWNMIGNPFRGVIDWNAVVAHNLNKGIIGDGDIVEGELLKFEGSNRFVSGGDLREYRGGFVETSTAINNFEIPVTAITSASGRVSTQLPEAESISIDNEEWKLQLFVKSSSINYLMGKIGFKRNSTDQTDKYDMSHVPSFEKYLKIDIEGIARNYKTPADSKKWEFTLPNNVEDRSLNLSWDIPQSNTHTLVFVDGITGRITDLSQEKSVNVLNKPGVVHQIYYGNKDNIYQEINVDRLSLINLFPNPVDDRISLEVISPEETTLDYSIISLDGRSKYFMSQSIKTGLNRVNIDLSHVDLPAGTYILKAKTFESQLIMTKFIKK